MSTSFYLTPELIQKIKEYARQQQRSESSVIRSILLDFFKNKFLEEKNGNQE
jgi:hypothetical protein